MVKILPPNAGDTGETDLIPGLGRSPGGGNGNHSRLLAWGILMTEKLAGLQSMGIQRVRHALVAELAFNIYAALYIIQSSPFKIKL